MNYRHPSYSVNTISVAMIGALALLLAMSFKLLVWGALVLSAGALLCPLITVLYLLMLNTCSPAGQQRILNQSLMTLYLFSIGMYVLLNVPMANDGQSIPAYQIVFDDLPRKFFASTLAFALGFYLPHAFCFLKRQSVLHDPRKRLILALVGGLVFFSVDFALLFSSPMMAGFVWIYCDSMLLVLALLFLAGVLHLLYVNHGMPKTLPVAESHGAYSNQVAVTLLAGLLCLACEYRLLWLASGWLMSAGVLFFPLVLFSNALLCERYGARACMRQIVALTLVAWAFIALFIGLLLLPAPDSFDINAFYSLTVSRRVLAVGLTALLLVIQTGVLRFLKTRMRSFTLRMATANALAVPLFCLWHSLALFAGVYPVDMLQTLALGALGYLMAGSVLALPLLLWIGNNRQDQRFVREDERGTIPPRSFR